MTEATRTDRRSRSVAILVNNPFVADTRCRKIASTLADAGYSVTVVAREAEGQPSRETDGSVAVVRLRQPAPLARLPRVRLSVHERSAPVVSRDGRLGAVAPRARRVVSESLGRGIQAVRYLRLAHLWADAIGRSIPAVDIWQAEELVMLPVALELRRRLGGVVVHDARDLDVHSAGFARLPGPWRALLAWRERAWARSADATIAASAPYAEELARAWGRSPTVVWNGPPDFMPGDPPERRWHALLGLPDDRAVVLYLGLAIPGRGIRELCHAMSLVPDAELVVAGYGPDYERYRDHAATLPHADRIAFPGAVPAPDVLPLVAAADVAVMPVRGDTLNHRLNTPTKLFDAMGAGTPVVASDLPGMAPIVRSTGCGELCDPTDPADIARAIRTILDADPARREQYRAACFAAAHGPFSWRRQAATLLELYDRLSTALALDPSPTI